jgi:hypothetical protein
VIKPIATTIVRELYHRYGVSILDALEVSPIRGNDIYFLYERCDYEGAEYAIVHGTAVAVLKLVQSSSYYQK